MGKDEQELNNNDNLNEEMSGLFKEDTLEIRIKKVLKDIKKIKSKARKIILKHDKNAIKGERIESITNFMQFIVDDLQTDLEKIEDSLYEIDKESNNLKFKTKK